MATRIEIEYDREYPTAELQALIARAVATINVMVQLGTAYQSLPGIAMAGYQTSVAAIQADLAALNALLDQVRVLLIAIDAKAGPLDELNKATLRTLSGLLLTDADRVLLDQITGPTSQSGGTTPPTP